MLKIFFMQNIYLEILLIIFIFPKKMYCNILCQRCCGEKEYIRIEKVFGDAIENGAADDAIDNLKNDISDIQNIFGSDEILSDLKQSRELLNDTTAFCYPFYEYNDYSEGLLKEAGFTMAFIGERTASYGPYKLAEVGADKMKIPRFVVVDYTTMSELKRYFNEIK